jgi:hypothetical protein
MLMVKLDVTSFVGVSVSTRTSTVPDLTAVWPGESVRRAILSAYALLSSQCGDTIVSN